MIYNRLKTLELIDLLSVSEKPDSSEFKKFRKKAFELIQNGADPNAMPEKCGSLLHIMAIMLKNDRTCVEWIKLLVNEFHADINIKDSDGNTALNILTEVKDDDGIKLFVNELKADLNIKDSKGRTPFMKALDETHFETALLLIRLGANKMDKDRDGNTILHLLSTRSSVSELIKELINTLSFPIDTKNSEGNTPLQYALGKFKDVTEDNPLSKYEDFEAIRTLLDLGANPDQMNGDISLFKLLSLYSDNEQQKLLLSDLVNKYHATPDTKSNDGLSVVDNLQKSIDASKNQSEKIEHAIKLVEESLAENKGADITKTESGKSTASERLKNVTSKNVKNKYEPSDEEEEEEDEEEEEVEKENNSSPAKYKLANKYSKHHTDKLKDLISSSEAWKGNFNQCCDTAFELLHAGAKPDAISKAGQDLLHTIHHCYPEKQDADKYRELITKLVKEYPEVDINSKDSDGQTIFQASLELDMKSPDTFKKISILLDLGSDPNQIDEDAGDKTIFEQLMESDFDKQEQLDFFDKLIKNYHVNTNVKFRDGDTLLDHLKERLQTSNQNTQKLEEQLAQVKLLIANTKTANVTAGYKHNGVFGKPKTANKKTIHEKQKDSCHETLKHAR